MSRKSKTAEQLPASEAPTDGAAPVDMAPIAATEISGCPICGDRHPPDGMCSSPPKEKPPEDEREKGEPIDREHMQRQLQAKIDELKGAEPPAPLVPRPQPSEPMLEQGTLAQPPMDLTQCPHCGSPEGNPHESECPILRIRPDQGEAAGPAPGIADPGVCPFCDGINGQHIKMCPEYDKQLLAKANAEAEAEFGDAGELTDAATRLNFVLLATLGPLAEESAGVDLDPIAVTIHDFIVNNRDAPHEAVLMQIKLKHRKAIYPNVDPRLVRLALATYRTLVLGLAAIDADDELAAREAIAKDQAQPAPPLREEDRGFGEVKGDFAPTELGRRWQR